MGKKNSGLENHQEQLKSVNSRKLSSVSEHSSDEKKSESFPQNGDTEATKDSSKVFSRPFSLSFRQKKKNLDH